MSTAPVADQRRLLDLQDLDTRVDQLAHRRRTLPVLATLTELESRLADLGTAVVASRTAASDLRRELAKAESDVEQVRARAVRDQARLDSGQASVKDVQALTAELASLARRQGDLEDVELAVMERLEAHTSALAELERAHADLLAQRDAAAAQRDREQRELDESVRQLRAQREEAVVGLDGALLALYEKLRAQLSGRGAAALHGSRCEGCRMDLNPADVERIHAAPPEQVVRCEECGRILVRSA